MNTIEQFKKIRTFIFDMDGVLTDGNLYIGSDVEYIRTSNTKDGYALQLAARMGYEIIIISGAESLTYKRRLESLGIGKVFMKVENKAAFLSRLISDKICEGETALYMGDDMPDIEAMKMCLISSCPGNACMDVRMVCDYISPFEGGDGCVRDVIEKVLRVNDDWC